MSETGLNRNKVADSRVSPTAVQFSPPPKKMAGNKIADEPSPSVVSEDSYTKLTIEKTDQDSCCGRSPGLSIFKLTACVICGVIFGICLEKGRVFEPRAIRGQMVFESFIMLKMFLAAVATGQIGMSVLSMVPASRPYFDSAMKEYEGCFSDKSIITSAVGAFALGAGMTLSGACPGMVLAQVGSWTPNAIFTLLGCLIGALTYGLVAPYIVRLTKPKNSFKYNMIHQKLKWPYIAIALPMAIVLAVVVFLLEWFWPWTKDLDTLDRNNPANSNVVTAVAWMPSVSGAIIGLLQVPLILLLKDTLGGSSSYVTVVSQWVVTKRLQELFPYLASKRCGLGNWWQVFYVSGAILGGALSSVASDTIASSPGASLPTALFGGLLMLWGARFAAGCTSGHGISGMGLLAWMSFVAVPFMFGGAIVTGFSMKATGALTDYVSSTFDA